MTMFTAQEKKDLKQLLARAVNQDEVMTLDGLHGYLYGLVSIPEPIMPSEWLPEFLGELRAISKQEADQLTNTRSAVANDPFQQHS